MPDAHTPAKPPEHYADPAVPLAFMMVVALVAAVPVAAIVALMWHP